MDKITEQKINYFINNSPFKGVISKFDILDYSFLGETGEWLVSLVLSGKKKATTSALDAYINEPLPMVGNISILLDNDKNPLGIIKTTKVTHIPFKEMTYDVCKLEGEDETVDTWKETHMNIFKKEGKELGYTFNENSVVVFEEFQLIYKI